MATPTPNAPAMTWAACQPTASWRNTHTYKPVAAPMLNEAPPEMPRASASSRPSNHTVTAPAATAMKIDPPIPDSTLHRASAV
jgi:hypothetical protein